MEVGWRSDLRILSREVPSCLHVLACKECWRAFHSADEVTVGSDSLRAVVSVAHDCSLICPTTEFCWSCVMASLTPIGVVLSKLWRML